MVQICPRDMCKLLGGDSVWQGVAATRPAVFPVPQGLTQTDNSP